MRESVFLKGNLQAMFFFGLLLFAFSCKTTEQFTRSELKDLKSILNDSPVFQESFTSLVLREPANGQIIFEKNGSHYFTPASNTKLLTLAVADRLIKDRIPALLYKVKGDSLIFQSFGDPTFLNENFQDLSSTYYFLQSFPGKLFFDYSNFQTDAYGSGWMWDDFPYKFQAEKSPMPIYENCVSFNKGKADSLEVFPPYFKDFIQVVRGPEPTKISRVANDNVFLISEYAAFTQALERKIPFRYSHELLVQLLSDTLNRQVELWNGFEQPVEYNDTLYSWPVDTVFSFYIKESDNLIAEQLLLVASQLKFGNQNTDAIIKWAKDSVLEMAPQRIYWSDGSGISRYNLITPETVSWLIFELYHEMGEYRLKRILPAGGQSGTIKNLYQSEEPYVFAKTGSMRYVHNLSGLVYTRSGKPLIFSFMHNNFTVPQSTIKAEMEKVLIWIRDNY
jgi:D-alanyl-D-alanine carboxypeptidase/D-alanyl-D-alanine-endopeptidase (penicillin-binding protein 4)